MSIIGPRVNGLKGPNAHHRQESQLTAVLGAQWVKASVTGRGASTVCGNSHPASWAVIANTWCGSEKEGPPQGGAEGK